MIAKYVVRYANDGGTNLATGQVWGDDFTDVARNLASYFGEDIFTVSLTSLEQEYPNIIVESDIVEKG